MAKAGRVCGIPGCFHDVEPSAKLARCPEHTVSRWSNSNRRSRLPANWRTIRAGIISRDGHRCTWTDDEGNRCEATEPLEVDHMNGPDDHRSVSLRTLCKPHHATVTSAQGRAARRDR